MRAAGGAARGRAGGATGGLGSAGGGVSESAAGRRRRDPTGRLAVAPGRRIDSLLPIPDADSLPLYPRRGIKASVCGVRPVPRLERRVWRRGEAASNPPTRTPAESVESGRCRARRRQPRLSPPATPASQGGLASHHCQAVPASPPSSPAATRFACAGRAGNSRGPSHRSCFGTKVISASISWHQYLG